jgi:dehydrogenase/reductase SDR family protein 12
VVTSDREAAPGLPRPIARAADVLLETTIAGSFSRIGYLVRRSAEGWGAPPRLEGAVFVVTGASSGIGRAIASALGHLGAEVWALGRDARRTRAAAAAAGARARTAIVDVTDASSVETFTERIGAAHERLDGIVHAAGALLRDYTVSSDGIEMTVATHVLGPFRLTWSLAPLLRRAVAPNIVTVSSGGMYTERFDLARLVPSAEHYDGVRTYARAKRAQVVLAGEWARRWASSNVASYAMHPGWVATPGLSLGMPAFDRLGPLLRRPEEGADTAVWLATGGARPAVTGFWHDRHRRSEHYLPWTRHGEGSDEGRLLWEWCATRTGVGRDA